MRGLFEPHLEHLPGGSIFTSSQALRIVTELPVRNAELISTSFLSSNSLSSSFIGFVGCGFLVNSCDDANQPGDWH